MTTETREKNPAAVELGRKGGSAKTTKPKGFAAMPVAARQKAGKKGGLAKAEAARAQQQS